MMMNPSKNSLKGNAFVVVWTIVHFMCYLHGNPFILDTEHQPLKWLMKSDRHSVLQEYNFKVTHHAKVVNQNANRLNWNPHANNMVL
jgi:hypothetical protein